MPAPTPSRAIGAATLVAALSLALGFQLGRSRSAKPDGPTITAGPRQTVALTPKSAAANPLKTATVRRQPLAASLQMVGSVDYDPDHQAVLGPLIPGRVVRISAGVGDKVALGQVMAEIESAEVGDALAVYLSATATARAAEANFTRERELSAQRISSDRLREQAEALAATENAHVRAATERLLALGLTAQDIAALGAGKGSGGRVPLRAPLAGTVVQRNISLGQAVERATDAFRIVNLTHLWVLLDLYEKDLQRVYVGQSVRLRTEAYPNEDFFARVAHIDPTLDESTRTSSVRIEFDSPDGKLRPGQFVTARLMGDAHAAGTNVLMMPRQAAMRVDGQLVAFVRQGDAYSPHPVVLGSAEGDMVQIVSGLEEGDEVVVENAFLLKSEMLR